MKKITGKIAVFAAAALGLPMAAQAASVDADVVAKNEAGASLAGLNIDIDVATNGSLVTLTVQNNSTINSIVRDVYLEAPGWSQATTVQTDGNWGSRDDRFDRRRIMGRENIDWQGKAWENHSLGDSRREKLENGIAAGESASFTLDFGANVTDDQIAALLNSVGGRMSLLLKGFSDSQLDGELGRVSIITGPAITIGATETDGEVSDVVTDIEIPTPASALAGLVLLGGLVARRRRLA